MASSLMQFFGFILALAGFIGLIVCTTMSEWKTSSHPGPSLLTAQTSQEGLWMSCVTYSTGQVNCKVFESLLEQSTDMQITRALMVISILLSCLAVMSSMAGMECTTCMDDKQQLKVKVAFGGAVLFVTAGLCALVATSWYGNKIMVNFHNQHHESHHHTRYDFGKALFLGWAASCLSLLGGLILFCNSKAGNSGQYDQYAGPLQSSAKYI
ncbi:claudin-1-like [Brienomyrus brachyistius]|uniref:claudin-1-like n=1 Tax=Brienomyrus brachyistius TaxID=42636 RepID=UPI0020B3F48B|nr:claudin-1-like [Brienomyrus brachyistius]